MGDSGDKVGEIMYILIVPEMQSKSNDRVLTLGSLPKGDFLLRRGRQKSKVLTSSLSPGGGAYSNALKAEKSCPCPSPRWWGSLVTYDGCLRPTCPRSIDHFYLKMPMVFGKTKS